MKQVKSETTDKWGPPFDTARRDLTHGAIHSLIDALFKQSLYNSKNLMKQVKS